MAVHIEEKRHMQKGMVKMIDEAGMPMVYDILQQSQYSFPIRSKTREILSNALDAVEEKLNALAILEGRAKPEDFYVEIEGEVYKDSRWTPEYFDPQWLDREANTIRMTYTVNEMHRDTVTFEDRAVGIGGKRLEGYFKLMWSTKRLNKKQLGKYGLGAKSPLAGNIEYYTMESRYNGQQYRFTIYNHDFYSIVPQWNMETGQENPSIIMYEGTENERRVYWEPTTDKNGTIITIGALKHHQQQYLDAVKQQMLYFPNIDLVLVQNGVQQNISYKADIMYEDDLIVLSDNMYFSRPHILLSGVNYGYVDWNELELEEKQGNIGIKVAPEDVEVNPSRESVLWTEKTKTKVLARFNEVVSIATELIQKELQDTDLVKWLRTCYAISGRYRERNDVLGRLANIVDLSSVSPRFSLIPEIRFANSNPLPGLYRRLVTYGVSHKGGIEKRQVMREGSEHLGRIDELKIICMKNDESVSNRKDKYLLKLYPTGFYLFEEPFDTIGQMEAAGLGEKMIEFYDKATDRGYGLKWRREAWDALIASEGVLQYEKIEVPESFSGSEEEAEIVEAETKEDAVKQEVARVAADERRKLEGKMILKTLLYNGSPTWSPLEVPIKEINNWEAEEIYYGTEVDSDLILFASNLSRDQRFHAGTYQEWEKLKWWRLNHDKVDSCVKSDYGKLWVGYHLPSFFDTKVMLIKVARSNTKYFRGFKQVQEFFISIKNKKITMSNLLIKWNTARLVKERLGAAAFLYNFENFNHHMASKYNALCAYVDHNWREVANVTDANVYRDLVSHLDNVYKFQELVSSNMASPSEVATMAQELFGNRELQDGMAVEPWAIESLNQILEYTTATGPLFNYIPYLTGYYESTLQAPAYKPRDSTRIKKDIPGVLEMELRQVLESKGVLKYGEQEPEVPVNSAGLWASLEAERSMLPTDELLQ